LRILKLVLGTELSAKNKMQVIGSLAILVLRYSFGIIKRQQEEQEKLERKTRKLLIIHGQHHTNADVDRLYNPKKQRGKGLMQLEAAHAVEITTYMENADKKEDPLIKVVRTHQQNTNSAVLQTGRCLKTEVQKETRKMKERMGEKTKEDGTGRGCMENCNEN